METEFIESVNNHIGIVHKICNSFFYGNPNREDYYQEILIRLWKAYPNFKNRSNFSTWMYRVALNAAIDINRKMTLLPKFTDLPMEDLNISDSENSIPAENADILYNTISHLNAIDKAIILMYLDDFSYEEISDAMGISKSNVGVKINRIKSQIKKKLDCHEKK